MANVILTNEADFSGVYGPESVPITFASNQVTTTIVNGLTATMTVNKQYWVDGPLLYTVVVKNESGETYTDGVLADMLNTTLSVFDSAYGVEIDGQKVTDYTLNGGLLNIKLPEIKDGATLTVTFQVTKA